MMTAPSRSAATTSAGLLKKATGSVAARVDRLTLSFSYCAFGDVLEVGTPSPPPGCSGYSGLPEVQRKRPPPRPVCAADGVAGAEPAVHSRPVERFQPRWSSKRGA